MVQPHALADFTTSPPGPPDGVVQVVDLVGVIGSFGSVPSSIRKARADFEPSCVDLIINITDVLNAALGFMGLPYQFLPSADDPCDSTCVSPFP